MDAEGTGDKAARQAVACLGQQAQTPILEGINLLVSQNG
jgi:hypothetical protein